MIFLILSIACSTAIVLVFKAFSRFGVDTFRAIIVNYFTCVLVGLPLARGSSLDTAGELGWVPVAVVLGFLFITLFFLIGRTTLTHGVAAASVSMKLGYVLPIVLAVAVYGETLSSWGVVGAAGTVVAVFLTAYRGSRDLEQLASHGWWAPAVIFVGSGVADSLVQFAEHRFFPAGGFEAFNIILFGTAGLLGLMFWLVRSARRRTWHFPLRDVLGGIALGVPNYGSIYFFLKTLNVPEWESAFVFPLNNIGIVVSSALFAFLLFRERLNVVNIAGLLVAVASIVLLSMR